MNESVNELGDYSCNNPDISDRGHAKHETVYNCFMLKHIHIYSKEMNVGWWSLLSSVITIGTLNIVGKILFHLQVGVQEGNLES